MVLDGEIDILYLLDVCCINSNRTMVQMVSFSYFCLNQLVVAKWTGRMLFFFFSLLFFSSFFWGVIQGRQYLKEKPKKALDVATCTLSARDFKAPLHFKSDPHCFTLHTNQDGYVFKAPSAVSVSLLCWVFFFFFWSVA